MRKQNTISLAVAGVAFFICDRNAQAQATFIPEPIGVRIDLNPARSGEPMTRGDQDPNTGIAIPYTILFKRAVDIKAAKCIINKKCL